MESQLVASSVNPFSTTQELHFTLPTDGYYTLEVTPDTFWTLPDNTNSEWYNFTGDTELTATDYGLAWDVTAAPEPATFSLMLIGAGTILLRRRRRA